MFSYSASWIPGQDTLDTMALRAVDDEPYQAGRMEMVEDPFTHDRLFFESHVKCMLEDAMYRGIYFAGTHDLPALPLDDIVKRGDIKRNVDIFVSNILQVWKTWR